MKPSPRLWAFRIATVIAAPALLLLLAEVALRVIGYGHRSDFTVPCTVQGHQAFCENDRFTWQFFPPRLFRLPYSFAIPVEKRPGTFRIFIVGESAAQGVPEPSYGFARYLEVMLRDRFPSMTFEVVNTGISSVNSHVLLPIARDLARRQPDLFILYIGNNEVVGPYGPQTTLTPPASSLFLIRTGIALKATRVGQLLGRIFQASANDSAPAEWRGIQMFLQHQVPADDPALARVYQNFQRNLSDIVTVARQSGAPVLISTVGANLKDCAPFGSLHRTDLSPGDLDHWQALVREGAALEDGGRPQAALERYGSAAAIDDRYAELQFRIGRVHWKLGDFAAARDRFIQARDLDVLRFRADSRMNQIIRSVAAAAGPGVQLLNGEAVLADASPHGVPGRELFYEHVHLNPQGNHLMARALFQSVVARLPGDLRRSSAGVEPPSAAEADRLLALTPFDRRRVARQVGEWLSQPPFTYQLGNDQQVREVQREATSTGDDSAETTAGYRWAIARAPGDRWLRFNYGVFLEEREPARSAAEFAAALRILPGDYRTREKLVDQLLRLGKFDEAIEQCRELLRRMPYHAPAYLTIGYALTQLGSLDESISAYQQAIRLQPAFAVDGYNQIGIVELHQGRLAAAAASFQKAIDLDKGHARTVELQRNLSYAQEELANLR
jgi:tetratricopeptide (TPR) repeat protein